MIEALDLHVGGDDVLILTPEEDNQDEHQSSILSMFKII
jgi:hypothetical protein